MCFKDLLVRLEDSGTFVTAAQVRWAFDSGKIPRPQLDGSLRYVFTEKHVTMLQGYFSTKKPRQSKSK